MVSFQQLQKSVQAPADRNFVKNDAQEELRKEVERLRVQVELAARGISIVEEGQEPEYAPTTDFLPAYVFLLTIY